MICTGPMTKLPPVRFGDLAAPVLSRWVARIYRWNESLWPGEPLGFTDPIFVRVPAAVGPELAASCVGIPVNYALRQGDYVRVHYTPDDGPVMATYPETFAGVVESCTADEEGLLATLLVSRWEAHQDLCFLERAGALEHAGLCLTHNIRSHQIGRTPWGAVVVDVERTVGGAVGFTAHPHIGGCRVLRRLGLDEALTEADAIPPEPVVVPSHWRATESGNGSPSPITAASAIATGKIAVSAVSQNLASAVGGSVGLNLVFQTAQSQIITTLGGTVRIDAKFAFSFVATSTGATLIARIRNATTGALSAQALWQIQGGLAANAITLTALLQETPAAGTYTYVLEALTTNVGGITTPVCSSAQLRVSEFKR